jgi:hypothetical protein
MFDIDNGLYEVSPAYRHLVGELRRLESENGVLAAAYGNAINDQYRCKADLARLTEAMQRIIEECQVLLRDDPGRNGSGR